MPLKSVTVPRADIARLAAGLVSANPERDLESCLQDAAVALAKFYGGQLNVDGALKVGIVDGDLVSIRVPAG